MDIRDRVSGHKVMEKKMQDVVDHYIVKLNTASRDLIAILNYISSSSSFGYVLTPHSGSGLPALFDLHLTDKGD